MPTERIQRQVSLLLDKAEAAVAAGDWAAVRDITTTVLRLDPENDDARAYLEAVARGAESVPQQAGSARPPDEEMGERRQLTVMFCDLVDSTAIAERLDPEDYRDVLRAYQGVCGEEVERSDGHVARYMGDGMLVYFGYPEAHEDDPRRAIRAALAMVQGVQALNSRAGAGDVSLAARVGVHTGLVVIAEMGSGERRETGDVVGETPNIAARLQALAESGTVVISDDTYRLVRGFFRCMSVGDQRIKGVSRPIPAWAVVADTGGHDRLEGLAYQEVTPLVGRENELAALAGAWERAKAGRGQVVLVEGEAGIGKSRLVRAAAERLGAEARRRLDIRCSPYHQTSAFHPVIEMLQRTLGIAPPDPPEQRLASLQAAVLQAGLGVENTSLIASLLSLPRPQGVTLAPMTAAQQKQRILYALKEWLQAVAQADPVLVVVEDLHWADPSTVEFLDLLIGRGIDGRVLAILTFRPEFSPPWAAEDYISTVRVGRLGQRATAEMVERVAQGRGLSQELIDELIDRTDGVPLFIEELTAEVLQSAGTEADGDKRGATTRVPVPATLQDSLMAKLDRLADFKEIYQVGAVLGREFGHELLSRAARLPEDTLSHGLRALVDAGLLFQRGTPPDSRYFFKHALLQEAAYQSLLKTRRLRINGDVAKTLEEHFPEIRETQPEIIARHYTEAEMTEPALAYWERAAALAAGRSAHVEAVTHLKAALKLLGSLPEDEARMRREFRLSTALARSITPVEGYAAAGPVFNRVLELFHRLPSDPGNVSVLTGVHAYYIVRGDLDAAKQTAMELVDLGRRWELPSILMSGYSDVVRACWMRGEVTEGHAYVERCRALIRESPASGEKRLTNNGVSTFMSYGPFVLHAAGYPDQAADIAAQTYVAVRDKDPTEVASSLVFIAWLELFRGDDDAMMRYADEAIAVASNLGFHFWEAPPHCFRGLALVRKGEHEDGFREFSFGLDSWRAMGIEAAQPNFWALRAECLHVMGNRSDALAALDTALQLIRNTGEHYYEPEVHRVRAQILLAAGDVVRGERSLATAISIARRLGAKSWQLRACTDLAELLHQRGDETRARKTLLPMVRSYTEGSGTPDLRRATALLGVIEGVTR
ncbi:MAG: AAA family ATPase [Chloroflexota bacterium]